MKKFLAMLLALVMALSLVACGEKKDDTKTEGGDSATGSVYYLNFKPESGQGRRAHPVPVQRGRRGYLG